MISCVDGDGKIVVFRHFEDETGAKRRQRIWTVTKKAFAIGPDLDCLEPDERSEVLDVIAMYKEADRLKLKAVALTFPTILRDVLTYSQADATDAERKLILSALSEGVRHIRRPNVEDRIFQTDE